MQITRRSSFFLALLGFTGLLTFAAWYYWTGTIYYSLHQIHRAVTRYDPYVFEQHVDLEHLTRRFIDDALAVFTQDIQNELTGAWEQVGATIGITVVQMMKPRLVDEVRQALIRGVESGSLMRGEVGSVRRSEHDQVSDVVAEFVSQLPKAKPLRLGRITVFGSSAMVELSVQPEAPLPPQTLRVRFIRTPERYWRATDIENTKDFLVALKKAEEQRLQETNQPIRQRIGEAITVASVTKEQGLNAWGTGKDAILVMTVKNTSPRIIRECVVHVTLSDPNGRKLHDVQVLENEPLASGESKEKVWPLGLNLFDEADQELYTAAASDVVLTAEVRKVVFAEGDAIKLADSLEEAAAVKKKAQIAHGPSASPVPVAQHQPTAAQPLSSTTHGPEAR